MNCSLIPSTHLLPSVSVFLINLYYLFPGQKVSNLAELELNVIKKDTVITTDKGLEITSDLVISCTGSKINSSAYSSTLSMFV